MSAAEDVLAVFGRLFADGPDTSCRTTWADDGAGSRLECVEIPAEDIRQAFTEAERLLGPEQ